MKRALFLLLLPLLLVLAALDAIAERFNVLRRKPWPHPDGLSIKYLLVQYMHENRKRLAEWDKRHGT